jgi:hypothetical protein
VTGVADFVADADVADVIVANTNAAWWPSTPRRSVSASSPWP